MAKNMINEDEVARAHSNGTLILRLLTYLNPFKLKVFVVLVLLILVMSIGLVNPLLLEIIIDKYIVKKDVNGLFVMAAAMIVLNLISWFASRHRILLMASVTNRILLNIRQELYTHIQKLSFNFFDNRPVGKVLARVIWDVNSLQALFESSVTTLIPEFLTFISVAIIMFLLNFKLALASMATLPFVILTLAGIEIFAHSKWQTYRNKRSNLNAFTHEDLSGIRVIQAFGAEEEKSRQFKDMVKEMMDAFMKAVILSDFFWPSVEFCWGLGNIVVFWFSYTLINNGTLSIGKMVAFTLYLSMFWRPVMNISNFYNTLITNFSAAERIFEILDIPPIIADDSNSEVMPLIEGCVEFKNITFSYDDDPSTKILNNVSFTVNKGETIALVGPTGAGKTTIVNLISRFYDTQEGEILIDGKNVKDVELDSLRSQMGIMLQDTFLFSATIRENIRYGKLNATDDEVERAALAVNAHGFILKLEKGYDTQVNERGSRLSVGQRQLISFARALLADPRILILDEATSNIDTFTERLVQEGIKKLLQNRTSFVIAHRLSTIRDCQKIMVIDNGEIVEAGSHPELMALKGLYYDLYMSQYKFLNEGA
ncbi:MAG TPA: ABC transporter ATP-binding protein [Clostridiaceae bacterium]